MPSLIHENPRCDRWQHKLEDKAVQYLDNVAVSLLELSGRAHVNALHVSRSLQLPDVGFGEGGVFVLHPLELLVLILEVESENDAADASN